MINRASGIVTLITDFGIKDAYTGQLKGALLSNHQDITIVDITHHIAPQDIQSAAYELSTSYKYFPSGTVHLAIVDPGVGTNRDILAAKGCGHFFIAPDNGTLSFLFEHDIDCLVRVKCEGNDDISSTFHGRDIMAPAAAKLAKGTELAEIGTPTEKDDCIHTNLHNIEHTASGLIGKVIRIDHFGNIRTSIRGYDLGPSVDFGKFIIHEQLIKGVCRTYAQHPAGTLCALIDSDGFVEFALINGSAATFLQAAVGDEVIYCRPV